MHKKSVKIGRVVPEIWSRTNTQTDRQTDRRTRSSQHSALPYRGRSNKSRIDWCDWQIESVLRIPTKQQVFSCVHSSGGVVIFSLYDCHLLDIRQINDWTKEISAARSGAAMLPSLEVAPTTSATFFTFFAPSLVGEWRTGSLLANETEVGGWSIV